MGYLLNHKEVESHIVMGYNAIITADIALCK